MKATVFILVCFACTCEVLAGDFTNLDFELLNTNNVQFFRDDNVPFVQGLGATFDLMPGWDLFIGGNRQLTVGFNYFPLFNGYITFFDKDRSPDSSSAAVLPYSYQPFVFPGLAQPVTLEQMGTIPVDAVKLTFDTPVIRPPDPPPEVRINDQVQQALPLS